jgi:hypothetical protein
MAQRGGKRPGAGRPKGAASKANEEARREAAATGETPQQYMLRVMRDEAADTDRRDRMAIAAAPYQHARLTAVEHMGKGGGPIEYSDVRDRLAHLVDREAAAGEPAEDNITTH